MKTLSMVLLTVCLSSSWGWGFVPPEPFHTSKDHTPIKRHQTIRPQLSPIINESFISFDGSPLSIKIDDHNGAPRLMTGDLGDVVGDPRSSDSYVELARSFISGHPEYFSLKNADYKLNRDSLFIGEDLQFVSFDVFRNQVKIKEAGVFFRFKQNRLVQVHNLSYKEAQTLESPVL